MSFTPKTWENTPSTDTPITAEALIDLETRLSGYSDELVGGGGATVVMGNDFIGGTSAALNINHTTGLLLDFPSMGTVKIEAYVAGDGGGGGTLSMLGVVYDGIATDSVLVDQGVSAYDVDASDAAGWQVIADGLNVGQGNQLVGYLTGTSNGVATTRKDTGSSGSSYWNNDTYSDGPASTFGTANADTAQYSLRVTFTPSDDVAIAIDELQLETADHEIRLDALEVSSAASPGFTGSVLANFPIPIDATVESDPIELAGPSVVVASAVGDQDFAGFSIRDSADGSTWRTHSGGSGVVYRPLMKVVAVNGSTAQADFNMSVATSPLETTV